MPAQPDLPYAPDATELYASLRRMAIVSADYTNSPCPAGRRRVLRHLRVECGAPRLFVSNARCRGSRSPADWQAPVERNRCRGGLDAQSRRRVPQARAAKSSARTAAAGAFAMEFLDAGAHPVGNRGCATALSTCTMCRRVGASRPHPRRMAAIPPSRASSPTDDIFLAIRLEPYLSRPVARIPTCARASNALVATTRRQRSGWFTATSARRTS